MVFADRHDAGTVLARRLRHVCRESCLILGLPRGGVLVAARTAEMLGAELDLLACRKLSPPGNPELAFGAVAEDGVVWINRDLAAALELSREFIASAIEQARVELCELVWRLRDARPRLPLAGRNVIVVDDGLATGATMVAAVRAARRHVPAGIVVAAPVASRSALSLLKRHAAPEEVVCPSVPAFMVGVSESYEHFPPVPDAEVLRALAAADRRLRERHVTTHG